MIIQKISVFLCVFAILQNSRAEPPKPESLKAHFLNGVAEFYEGKPEENSGPDVDIVITLDFGAKLPKAIEWKIVGVGEKPISKADFDGGKMPSGKVNLMEKKVLSKKGYSNKIYIQLPFFIDDKLDEGVETFAFTVSNIETGKTILDIGLSDTKMVRKVFDK